MASDPKAHKRGERGRSPDREQEQVHIVQGNDDILKQPPNHESARNSEENVSPGPEPVVPCDLATNPTSQGYGT
jgi:hypothetical protein